MVDLYYKSAWEELLELLDDTGVPKERYHSSLEVMADEIENRLAAVREELTREEEGWDDP